MFKIVKKIAATVSEHFSAKIHRASSPMWKPKYPIIGFISAVVLFLTIASFKDYVKTVTAFRQNKTPSSSFSLLKDQNDNFPLIDKDKLAQVLGEFDEVKGVEDASIVFNYQSTFTAPVTFEENITAPNVVYQITAGDGITISGDPQNPVISADIPAAQTGISSIENLTGDIDLAAGTNISISVEGNKITINNTASDTTTSTTLDESAVEAFIFDSDNTGTLSSGTLALDSLSYTGTVPSSVVQGSYTGITEIGDLSNLTVTGNITAGSSAIVLTTAGGYIDSDALNLASGGGLESVGDQLTLLTSCANGQLLKWDGSAWVCSSDSGASAVVDVWQDSVDIGSNVDTLNFINAFQIGTSGAGTIANIDIRDDSLDFSELADILSLDASTSIKTGSTEVLYFDANTGYVGINNTNPGYTLDVNGDMKVSGNVVVNGVTISDFTGAGITIAGGSLSVDILSSASGTGSTSSNSGLEFIGNQLSLLQGCDQDEVLAWDASNNIWACTPVGGIGAGDITAVGRTIAELPAVIFPVTVKFERSPIPPTGVHAPILLEASQARTSS